MLIMCTTGNVILEKYYDNAGGIFIAMLSNFQVPVIHNQHILNLSKTLMFRF